MLAQKVIFSNRMVTIHASRQITSDKLIIKSLKALIRMIYSHSSNTENEEVGTALAKRLETRLEIFEEETHDLIYMDSETREKKSLNFLSTALKYVTGTPSHNDWVAMTNINAHLLSLQKSNGRRIQGLKNAFRINKNEMNKHLGILRGMITVFSNVSNSIEAERNQSMALSDILIYHARAQSVLDSADFEVRGRQNIIQQAMFNLASKHMIPAKKLLDIVANEAKSDRINSPAFQTEDELNLLYNFQSTITLYDHKSHTFHSLLNLPMIDYSEQFTTYRLPPLDSRDENRIFSLRTLTHQSIDLVLCSDRKKTLRFLSSQELLSCQKHLTNEVFICHTRDISIKMNHLINCNNLNTLPDTLVIDMNDNNFAIERATNQTLSIFCNGSFHHKIDPEIGIITIKLPPSCSLVGDTVTINQKLENNTTKNITNNEKVVIAPVKLNPWKPFPVRNFADIDLGSLNTSVDPTDKDLDYDDIEYEEDVQTKQILRMTSETHGAISITSICVAVMATIGVITSIVFIRMLWLKTTGVVSAEAGAAASAKVDSTYETSLVALDSKVRQLEMNLATLETNLIKNIGINVESLREDISKSNSKMKDIILAEEVIEQKIADQKAKFHEQITVLNSKIQK